MKSEGESFIDQIVKEAEEKEAEEHPAGEHPSGEHPQ